MFQAYGSLGELAIMVLPQSQIVPLIRKFELAGPSKDVNVDSSVDVMSTIKDSTVKEIVAKESLQYKPRARQENSVVMDQNLKALEALMEVRQVAANQPISVALEAKSWTFRGQTMQLCLIIFSADLF